MHQSAASFCQSPIVTCLISKFAEILCAMGFSHDSLLESIKQSFFSSVFNHYFVRFNVCFVGISQETKFWSNSQSAETVSVLVWAFPTPESTDNKAAFEFELVDFPSIFATVYKSVAAGIVIKLAPFPFQNHLK